MKPGKMMLVLAVLAAALVLNTGCGSPATPVPPTVAATATTARTAPTIPPASPTRALPTPVPPTLAPTAVLPTPSPTRPAATATRTRAPATKAPAVVPTKAAAVTPTPKYPVPAGQAGVVVRNFYGETLNFTMTNHDTNFNKEYKVPANGELLIVVDPGSYDVSGNIFGQAQDWKTLQLQPGLNPTSDWYNK